MRPIVILLLCLAANSPRQPAPSAMTLLDLYASGEFDAVVSILGDHRTSTSCSRTSSTTRRPGSTPAARNIAHVAS